MTRFLVLLVCGLLGLACSVKVWAQQQPTTQPTTPSSTPSPTPSLTKQPPVPKSDPVPRSATEPTPEVTKSNEPKAEAPALAIGESSSHETRGDTTPPPDDAKKHPDSKSAIEEVEGLEQPDSKDGADAGADGGTSNAASDVEEFHPWDPHRAGKNVEVGDYYFKRKNYAGAESRYREALLYKPNDAQATLALARCLDQEGHAAESIQNYQAYLKILPNGPFADEAKHAVTRLSADKLTAANPNPAAADKPDSEKKPK